VPRVIFAPGIPDLVWDTESVLSGAEVRRLLRARSAEGVFWDWPGDTKVILAVK